MFDPLVGIVVTEVSLMLLVSAIYTTLVIKKNSYRKRVKPQCVEAGCCSVDPVKEIAVAEACMHASCAELEELRRKVWSYRRLPTRLAGYVVTFVGAAVLVGSMVFFSSVWAMIGLALTFWGVFFFFLKPTSLVKADLLDSASCSLLENVRRLVSEFGLKGKGVYLPPRYLKDAGDGLVFVPAKEEVYVPTVDEVGVAEDRVFLKNPRGVCLVPSGVALANLFERELGTSFVKVDLEYLMRNLPRVFVEALEIAEDFELSVEGGRVHVRIEGAVYKDLCDEVRGLSGVCGIFGCPLCSSIACAVTRTTGKPVIIEKIIHSKDDRTIQVYYRILGTIEKVSRARAFKPTGRHLGYLLSGLGLVPAALGLITLAFVGWLTWYDITTWSKSLALIFFGPRTGEAISIGIGMRVIHYLLIGSALFLLGILMFFRKRRRAHIEE